MSKMITAGRRLLFYRETIKRRLQPSTLQRRILLYLLIPTFLILATLGFVSLKMVSSVLLEQWKQTAIANLQRSAHHVDMRLMRPKELLRFLVDEKRQKNRPEEFEVVLEQLRGLSGVIEVNFNHYGGPGHDVRQLGSMMNRENRASVHHMSPMAITAPRFDQGLKSETVSVIAVVYDRYDEPTGYIEVIISFYDLIDQIVNAPWWASNEAVLVDDAGKILAGTRMMKESSGNSAERKIFDQTGELEKATWDEMQENVYGTVFGKGIPPERVSGFYRLSEAPWTMVLMSSGEDVLHPILSFRNYYFLVGAIGIILALVYIRFVIGHTAAAIVKVSEAARRLADGGFSAPLPDAGNDEVGELTRSFNVMAEHLQERLELREEMNIAREIQQTLLPQAKYASEGIEAAGLTLYSQQTGGDYFDIIPDRSEKGLVTVMVGDVVGHGIGAALLMASVRALLRGRASQPGSPAEVIADVNSLLYQDTYQSGNFASLFHLTVDRKRRTVEWVRCGHDPALLYSPAERNFLELKGNGLILGVEENYRFSTNQVQFTADNQLLFIGSDGVWEAENKKGERFGKDRIKTLLAAYHDSSAEKIVGIIAEHVHRFQEGLPQADDVTMVVIKTWSTG